MHGEEPGRATPGRGTGLCGLIVEADSHIPFDVVRRAGERVFFSVPRIVVGTLPRWEPPPNVEREAKRGPRAREVKRLYGSRAPTIQEKPPAG